MPGRPLACAPNRRTVAAFALPFVPMILLPVRYLLAGSSRESLPSATRVMIVVAVNGLVIDAMLNGVWGVAFTPASRFAQPKPSSQTMRPPCTNARATPVASPRSMVSRIRLRIGSKFGEPVESGKIAAAAFFLVCARPPIAAEINHFVTSRRFGRGFMGILWSLPVAKVSGVLRRFGRLTWQGPQDLECFRVRQDSRGRGWWD